MSICFEVRLKLKFVFVFVYWILKHLQIIITTHCITHCQDTKPRGRKRQGEAKSSPKATPKQKAKPTKPAETTGLTPTPAKASGVTPSPAEATGLIPNPVETIGQTDQDTTLEQDLESLIDAMYEQDQSSSSMPRTVASPPVDSVPKKKAKIQQAAEAVKVVVIPKGAPGYKPPPKTTQVKMGDLLNRQQKNQSAVAKEVTPPPTEVLPGADPPADGLSGTDLPIKTETPPPTEVLPGADPPADGLSGTDLPTKTETPPPTDVLPLPDADPAAEVLPGTGPPTKTETSPPSDVLPDADPAAETLLGPAPPTEAMRENKTESTEIFEAKTPEPETIPATGGDLLEFKKKNTQVIC